MTRNGTSLFSNSFPITTQEPPKGTKEEWYFQKYFANFCPHWTNRVSRPRPTVDRSLLVQMFVEGRYVSEAKIRYQFQTWKNTRKAESRLTDGFKPLRDRAAKDDVIIFQRGADEIDKFRSILLRQNTPEFDELKQIIDGRKWGPLYQKDIPVTQEQISTAILDLNALVQKPFVLFSPEIHRNETRQNRIARASVFRQKVRKAYAMKCAISGIMLATPGKPQLHEVHAAHVVPVSKGGSDDFRNGICMAQTLHWAFDRGLFGILPSRKIYIPKKVKCSSRNRYLLQFENKAITPARDAALRVHSDAIEWHMENVVSRWK